MKNYVCTKNLVDPFSGLQHLRGDGISLDEKNAVLIFDVGGREVGREQLVGVGAAAAGAKWMAEQIAAGTLKEVVSVPPQVEPKPEPPKPEPPKPVVK